MTMVSDQPGYRSYLLRLWQVGGADVPTWRASLEDVRTHECRNFASLEQLCAFLTMQIRSGPGDTEPPPGTASADDQEHDHV
jgi:hypothetical protein